MNIIEAARLLLGKQVEILLTGDEPKVIARGQLLSFGDHGEAIVIDDMGFTNYCWPMLDIRERENFGSWESYD